MLEEQEVGKKGPRWPSCFLWIVALGTGAPVESPIRTQWG